MLTAIIKYFLKFPSRSQDLVTRLLKLATEESHDPDVRDRGFIYWRLLANNPKACREAVLAPRPPIRGTQNTLPGALLDVLLSNIGSLSSVLHEDLAKRAAGAWSARGGYVFLFGKIFPPRKGPDNCY